MELRRAATTEEEGEIWVKNAVCEERWDRVQEVNLEQISIVIEQESRMWRVVTGSG